MFLINLTYKTELKKIDQFLNEHITFLNEQYALEHFLASGPKIPRTGGIVLSKVENRALLEKIIEKDPFKINGLADYEITEFTASKTCEALKVLIE